jgi:hypothetical protein
MPHNHERQAEGRPSARIAGHTGLIWAKEGKYSGARDSYGKRNDFKGHYP